jgi:putative transposase
MSERHNRRSIRLQGYDYSSAGAYFVTVCAKNNEFVLASTGAACCALFGHVCNGKMALNDLGRILEQRWHALPEHHPNVELDEFIIMPNHMHFIVCIDNRAQQAAPVQAIRAQQAAPVQAISRSISGPESGSLGAIVRSFKSSVTRHINEYRGTPGSKVWLRNYYEHIIRSESELDRIRAYIAENPARWAYDRENPNAIPAETKEKWAV